MHRFLVAAAAAAWGMAVSAAAPLDAATPALLELDVDGRPLQGRLLALGEDVCWLLDRDGRLHRVDLASVRTMERVSSEFVPLGAPELRNRLRREFGTGWEVAATEHYLVCAAAGTARPAALLCEDVFRSFRQYFAVRGVRLPDPEFPMVAVVFPDRASFAQQCRADGVSPVRELYGYYSLFTNRVNLLGTTEDEAHEAGGTAAAASERLHGTLVHEAIHQAAFNTGLHARTGETPQWVVEGLATVFEVAAVRDSGGRLPLRAQINRERHLRFGHFAASRRERRSLAAFVANDAAFARSPLDAYGEAWALSFYLIQTRPVEYVRYLQGMAGRDPLRTYGPDERLQDFRQAFGEDLERVEADFLRYIDRLKTDTSAGNVSANRPP